MIQIKKNKMGEVRIAYRFLVGKTEGK